MSTLAAAIRTTLAGWGQEPDEALQLERRIFGSTDPQHIAQSVEDFCTQVLGAPVADCLFWRSHVGSVSALHLADGRRVVVKAFPATADFARLTVVQRVQRFLVARGFPCPPPLLGPVSLAQGYALVEEFVAVGALLDAHDPAVRRALAQTLARLVGLLRELGPMPELAPPARSTALWPTPHHAMFDFTATAAGAEWIDDLARSARQVFLTDSSPHVLGHLDWRTEHVRFVDGEVRIVYDWDSLNYVQETALLGAAAASFPATWDMPVEVSPRPEETRAFIDEYEEARGVPFTAAEHAAIIAHVTYTRAYSARCEHALDPTATTFPAGGLRAGLRLHQAALVQ